MSRHSDEPLKAIDGRARTVRELLDKAKYAIDFYQREYAWQERQVRELLDTTEYASSRSSRQTQAVYVWQERQVRKLIDDLTGKFLDHYEAGHARHEVERYGHYFLGSVVLRRRMGKAPRAHLSIG